VDYARRVLAAWAGNNSGLLVFEGKLIEKPVLRSLERVLATHAAAQG